MNASLDLPNMNSLLTAYTPLLAICALIFSCGQTDKSESLTRQAREMDASRMSIEGKVKANGSSCMSDRECSSGYCLPGPEELSYCVDKLYNCAKPGTQGAFFGSAYLYNHKAYYCQKSLGLRSATLIEASQSDQSQLIQTTINSAAANSVLVLANGLHSISKTIEIRNKTRIKIVGIVAGTERLTNLYYRELSFGKSMFNILESSSVEFENFSAIGDAPSPTVNDCTPSLSGAFFLNADSNSKSGSLNYVKILGFNNGIKLDGNSNSWIISNIDIADLRGKCSGTGYGILIASSQNIVQGNRFLGNPNGGRHAIYMAAGASYNSILKNKIENFNSSSITSMSYPYQSPSIYNKIEENSISGQTWSPLYTGAIDVFGRVTDITIRNNSISNCNSDGIRAENYLSAAPENIYTIGNTISNVSGQLYHNINGVNVQFPQ